MLPAREMNVVPPTMHTTVRTFLRPSRGWMDGGGGVCLCWLYVHLQRAALWGFWFVLNLWANSGGKNERGIVPGYQTDDGSNKRGKSSWLLWGLVLLYLDMYTSQHTYYSCCCRALQWGWWPFCLFVYLALPNIELFTKNTFIKCSRFCIDWIINFQFVIDHGITNSSSSVMKPCLIKTWTDQQSTSVIN